MTITEIFKIADRLVFSQTGKHLDDLQEVVIKGVWQGQTYQAIAEECQHSESRIRDVGYELWKVLSEALGEDIKKNNFRSTFERLNIKLSPNFLNNVVIPRQTLSHSNQEETENAVNPKLFYQDLTLAPQIIKFHNRKTELKTISNWIGGGEKPNTTTRLISVLGLSGIGKTTLVRRFVDLNLEQFELIIWRSLKYPQILDLLINDFLNVFQQDFKENIPAKLKQLFDIFTDKKCLIILDNVENIFASAELAGQYQSEYKDYQNFFKMIAEVEHKSNIILISQEQCPEMHCLDEELYQIKSLELSGLDNIDILKNTGLKDEDSWSNLMELYEGNPMYLQDVAILIKDVFDGNVTEFLAENSSEGILPVVTNKMRSHFNQLFNRLSPIEQQIILELSKFDQPISRENLRQGLDLSSMDLINGLQSLQQRYLVTKIKSEKIFFKLSTGFQEYVKNSCKNKIK